MGRHGAAPEREDGASQRARQAAPPREKGAATDTSILIATYGGDEWRDLALERAKPSAEAQRPHEVVAVHLPDGNIADARNEAARQATGEWLCFLDGDDELLPAYLSSIERSHDMWLRRGRQGNRVLFTPAVSYIIGGRRRPARIHREVPLSSGNWLVIGTVVAREVFFEVGGFRDWPHGLEDWDLWARIWRTTGCEIVKVPRAVYLAHWNAESKHHVLQRDKEGYVEAYNRVAASHAEEAVS